MVPITRYIVLRVSRIAFELARPAEEIFPIAELLIDRHYKI
jgi:hypothetical protein